jgi:hypothetical protein
MGQFYSPSRQTNKLQKKKGKNKRKKEMSLLGQLGRPSAQPRALCVAYWLPLA